MKVGLGDKKKMGLSLIISSRKCSKYLQTLFLGILKDSRETEYRNKQLYCPRLRAVFVSHLRLPARVTQIEFLQVSTGNVSALI